MAVKRTYSCNFCGKEFILDKSRLIGIEFTGGYQSSVFNYKPWMQTENHLCIECINSITSTPIPDELCPDN